MANVVVKVSGVSDELLKLIDRRWQAGHFADRSEYIRDLIRKDLASEAPARITSIADGVKAIFGAVHEQLSSYGIGEEEIDADIDHAIADVRAKRKAGRTRKAV